MNDSARPKTSSFGHSWPGPHRLRPALVTAVVAMARSHARRRYVQRRWVLDYNFAPAGGVQVGRGRGVWWERTRPALHLYAPRTPYLEVPASPARALQSAYVLLEHGRAAGLHKLLGPQQAAQFVDPDGEAGALLARIAEDAQADDAGRCRAQAALLALIARLHQARELEPGRYEIQRADAASPQGLVQRVEQYLHDRLRQRVRLRDIARHLSVSESTLSHRFREATGRSPIARLLELRVNLAKGLLERGLPLKTVADQTGFADAFHLSRTFKRVEGVSPRAWLRG